jgi:hypothetical protein
MRQVKVEPDWLELNVKVGVESPDGSDGLESIAVSGALRSTYQV